MIRYLIIVLFASFYVSISAQTSSKDLKKLKEDLAIKYIHDLKKGVLVVRLKTRQNTINALKKNNYDDKAKIVEDEVKRFNNTLMKAFEDEFDFCEVYFINSNYTNKLKYREFDSLLFYNTNMELDASIKPNLSNFLIAEYSTIEADTVSYYQDSYMHRGEDGLEKRDSYSDRGTFGFEALLIRNDQFVQLSDPFPFYVRTWDSSKKPYKVVRKMNKNLHRYYETVK